MPISRYKYQPPYGLLSGVELIFFGGGGGGGGGADLGVKGSFLGSGG